ncbi:putative transmembrane protein-like [Capsicum annuum]|nr:putative transmembrane protein-like [Capsicum annuum]
MGSDTMSKEDRKYGTVEWEIGARGKPYAKWAAEMAVGLETGVPWNVRISIDLSDLLCSGIQKFGGPIPHFLGDLLKMWHLQFQGLLNEPKYGHLRDLHKAISSGGCAAFLSNYGPTYSVRVTFQKMQYDLPPWSISILPDCRTAVYNTARISSQSSQMKMIPVGGGLSWESHTEETPSADADDSDTLSTSGLWEQINVTSSDYLWYMTKSRLWRGLDNPMLTYSGNVKLRAGINKFLCSVLLLVSHPIQNVGLHFETWNAGVLGRITLSGLNEGTRDLTKQRWANKVGLKGETLSLCTLNGSSSVKWVKDLLLAQKQPVTWYKATFDAPEGNGPLTLDMGSMGKGQIWINGEGIGHQWPGYIARGICGECSYAGIYSEKKCQANCQPRLKNWHMATSGISNILQPKAHLWCPAGLKISDIQFTRYGLPQGTCGNYHEGPCYVHKLYPALGKVLPIPVFALQVSRLHLDQGIMVFLQTVGCYFLAVIQTCVF